MDREALIRTATHLVADNKGILAADESTPTMTKRLEQVGVTSTADTRRDYRADMFLAKDLGRYIGGVILFDETIRQSTADGAMIPDLLLDKGIVPGIKVDTGAKPLAGCPGEKVTEGLDGLRARLAEYREMGAGFAKWRAVITIGTNDVGQRIPSDTCIAVNAHALARYAALCQEAGIVPIVEPEVLMDGDHDIETCDAVTRKVWQVVFDALHEQRVHLPGILLKPSMIISGKSAPDRAGTEEVAQRTVAALRDHVPASVPGIVFLSGGQTPDEATEHLRLMNTMGPHPWKLSFSYGRALQEPALAAYAKDQQDVAGVQEALLARARANSAACTGRAEATAQTVSS